MTISMKYRIKRRILMIVDDYPWWCMGGSFVLGFLIGMQ